MNTNLAIASIFTSAVVLLPCEAEASCPPPDWLTLEVDRSPPNAEIDLRFGWDGNGTIEGCVADEAIEFEVWIDTDPVQKCFAAPIGGRDDDVNSPHVERDLPSSGYVDVWNYAFDYTVEELGDILNAECGVIPQGGPLLAKIYDFFKSVEDDVAQFAIGVTYSSELRRGESYGAHFSLEVPSSDFCNVPEAAWGHVTVRMSTFPNICTLPLDVYATQCPHFIGFKRCQENDPQSVPLVNRICAPTDKLHFGITGGNQYAGYGQCLDFDNDGYYGVVGGKIMYGSQVGDCDDNNPGITNSSYDFGTGICQNCTYAITKHQCLDWTDADGLGVGGGRMFEICGVVVAETGEVGIAAQKYDGSDFGDRPYQVRVSEYDDPHCGPGFNYYVSDYAPEPGGIGTDQLIFYFDSIWAPGQTTKGYCVTASTRPGDPGYDPNNSSQKSWWWSDRIELTRTCQ